MLGCSEVGEGQGHGCWVSMWSVGLVGSCRQSPMEYLVEPVCLAHCIVLCFGLGHLMCCLCSGPWYISVFSRIGQIPRRDSRVFSLFPTQGLCFRVLYNWYGPGNKFECRWILRSFPEDPKSIAYTQEVEECRSG